MNNSIRQPHTTKKIAIAILAGVLACLQPAMAQDALGGSRPSTVLPTDVVPLPLPAERQALGESLKLRLWQKLPARFYFSATTETSFRIETNVFQFPTKRSILKKFAPDGVGELDAEGQLAVYRLTENASARDVVYRITPNVTAGWSLTPNTRIFANYFLLRDKLFKNNTLNTTINQAGLGIEHSRSIGQKLSYELQFTARELWQAEADPVFDYLPSLTLSYYPKPGWVAYFNSLLQLRSTDFIELPNRNITPFYTWGVANQRGKWSFSANATMLNTFQKGLSQSRINFNNGSWILDFEIARQVLEKVPGFQAFARAEPVYNMAGRNLPGLSGMDFRMYFGLRMSAYKPSLLGTMQMLKQHYQQPEPKQKRRKQKLVEPETNTTPQDGSGQPKEGDDKKKQKGDPGAPIGFWQHAEPDDLSVITLDSSLKPMKKIGSFTLPPSTSWLEKATIPEAQSELPVATKDVDPTPAEAITPTAAPIHGFIEDKVSKAKPTDTISSINLASSID